MLPNFAKLMARINNPSDKSPLRCETWAVSGVWHLSVYRQVFTSLSPRNVEHDTLVHVEGVHLDELAKEALQAIGLKAEPKDLQTLIEEKAPAYARRKL